MGLNSDAAAATLLLLTGSVLGMLASQALWSREKGKKSLKSVDLENYTTLAINLLLSLLRKLGEWKNFIYRE